MNSPFKKENPFSVNTSYDVYNDPAAPGNYYEGGSPTVNQGNRVNVQPMQGLGTTNMPGVGNGQIQSANMDNMPTGDGRYGRTKMGILGQSIGGALGSMGAGKDGKLSGSQQMGLIGGAMGIAQGLIGRKKRRNAQRKAKNEYNDRRTEYENLDTSNLAAGFKNSFQNMENTYEDLTVNQQQAQFQSQNLQGAAGGSGIGGLAQALANQSQISAQASSASIGAQESANQRAKAQGAASIQQMEMQGDQFAQTQRLAGADAARGLQYDKTGTLLGMAQADKAAADQAIQEANSALFGGIGQIAGVALTGGVSSLLKPKTP